MQEIHAVGDQANTSYRIAKQPLRRSPPRKQGHKTENREGVNGQVKHIPKQREILDKPAKVRNTKIEYCEDRNAEKGKKKSKLHPSPGKMNREVVS